MNSADFRNELEKKMPGYKWTVHRTDNPARLEATGIQSSGSNRLSTLKVSRTDEGKTAWYEVMSAGRGARSPWAGRAGNITLARALRDLQTHYQRKASSYQSLANRLEEGRRSEPELSQPSIEGPPKRVSLTTEVIMATKHNVECHRRKDGSAWISVGDPANGPHFQCDFLGDVKLGPVKMSDFAATPPPWVQRTLNLENAT